MTGSELELQRKNTKAFIDANPTTVVLTPRVRQRRASGGWSWAPQPPRSPQILRLIPAAVGQLAATDLAISTTGGVERRIDYEVLGEWNSSMFPGDVFTVDGDPYEIISMYPNNGYEIRATASRQMDRPVTV
jgi:hypothetical protein